MSKILIVWELGNDLGHLGSLHPLIEELNAKGHKIFLAVKDLSKLERFIWPTNIRVLQSPVHIPHSRQFSTTHCFADILAGVGFDCVQNLRPLVMAWISLFDLIEPDEIIFDHAPSALLASSNRQVARIIFSNGFVTPPPNSPATNINLTHQIDQHILDTRDKNLVKVINQVALDLNLEQIKYVSDIFNVDKIFISSYQELDFYQQARKNVSYVKEILVANQYIKPFWSLSSSQKIFAYLKYGFDPVIPILDALSKTGANVVCFCANIPDQLRQKYHSQTMFMSDAPFDIAAMYREVNVIICHGGKGLISFALNYGCPMILVPTQLEQLNTTKQLEKINVAVGIYKDDSSEKIETKVLSFFSNPNHTEAAKLFAYRTRDQSDLLSVKEAVNQCEEYL